MVHSIIEEHEIFGLLTAALLKTFNNSFITYSNVL